MDEKNIIDWHKLKVGAVVNITDEQTIKDNILAKKPNAVKGTSGLVQEIKTIVEQGNACEWLLINILAGQETIWILVKSVGKLLEIRKLNSVEWIEAGSRKDVIDAGHLFLFCEPQDPNNFIPKDLKLSESFALTFDDKEVPFNKKCPTFYGTLHENGEKTFAAVTEYKATTPVASPEFMVVEVGGLDDNGDAQDEGGFVLCFEGYTIQPMDVELLA
jgi:hypothetical protein